MSLATRSTEVSRIVGHTLNRSNTGNRASDCSLSVAYDSPGPTGTHPGRSIFFIYLPLLTGAQRTLIPI